MLLIVSARLRFQTDEMVIGSMLSAAAITYFSIGARIMDYAFQVVATLAQLFVPCQASPKRWATWIVCERSTLPASRLRSGHISHRCYRADSGQIDHRDLGRAKVCRSQLSRPGHPGNSDGSADGAAASAAF